MVPDTAVPEPVPHAVVNGPESGSPGHGAAARCSVCGRVIEADEPWQALLRTLSQLARFGLDSEGRPLLEPASED